ncbi:hypothetical protein PAECIP111891_02448 [Paenibacillus allorhizoplanae]|uniref:DUF6881 domain-containing protein n=1 Tax=Paenibacillus allorhizoplanae TaxID=2905648 RepID=A0ABM9C5S4_9BACL|nr:hypothetical protein [Paenibacillus allorhizoplanae]CAH1203852.1 hypothetical protein PAECIP111891_02448 [Paenibacillus allorhizoplanae]
MEYIYVEWKHSFIDEPIILISEIDENRFETRKIEIYRNGKVGFAYQDVEVMNTRLSIESVPSIEEIATEVDFIPKTILKEEFEKFWSDKVVPLL